MQTFLRRPHKSKQSVIFVPTDEIAPNPAQPRKIFADDGLEELSASISQYGLLNPLSVRLRSGKYELIAGERRLRAAKLAGLYEVPCIILDVNMEESSLLALVENLQRRNLDFIEEAEGISRLMNVFSMSQEECARRLGKSQSAVANKLRLLRLPEDVLDTLRAHNLTERHGRALLRLPDADSQRAALEVILDEHMNVAATEDYIARLLNPEEDISDDEGNIEPDILSEAESESIPDPTQSVAPEKTRRHSQKKVFVLKDVRLFLNTLTHGLSLMKQGGIDADVKQEETDSELVLTISIPKKKP